MHCGFYRAGTWLRAEGRASGGCAAGVVGAHRAAGPSPWPCQPGRSLRVGRDVGRLGNLGNERIAAPRFWASGRRRRRARQRRGRTGARCRGVLAGSLLPVLASGFAGSRVRQAVGIAEWLWTLTFFSSAMAPPHGRRFRLLRQRLYPRELGMASPAVWTTSPMRQLRVAFLAYPGGIHRRGCCAASQRPSHGHTAAQGWGPSGAVAGARRRSSGRRLW